MPVDVICCLRDIKRQMVRLNTYHRSQLFVFFVHNFEAAKSKYLIRTPEVCQSSDAMARRWELAQVQRVFEVVANGQHHEFQESYSGEKNDN